MGALGGIIIVLLLLPTDNVAYYEIISNDAGDGNELRQQQERESKEAVETEARRSAHPHESFMVNPGGWGRGG